MGHIDSNVRARRYPDSSSGTQWLGNQLSLADDITRNAVEVYKTKWLERRGVVVPDSNSVTLGNDAVKLETATVLYADLDQSTSLVESKKWEFAAEVYKTFLYAATRLIRSQGGSIVSYDGRPGDGYLPWRRAGGCSGEVRASNQLRR